MEGEAIDINKEAKKEEDLIENAKHDTNPSK